MACGVSLLIALLYLHFISFNSLRCFSVHFFINAISFFSSLFCISNSFDNFSNLQREFIMTAVKESQEEAVSRVLKRYKKH